MLPRTPSPPEAAPPSARIRRLKNYDEELASWFQGNAARAVGPEGARPEDAWPDESPSARIPFLMF